jgi:hypothetical protein
MLGSLPGSWDNEKSEEKREAFLAEWKHVSIKQVSVS